MSSVTQLFVRDDTPRKPVDDFLLDSLDKKALEKDITAFIKREFDKKYNALSNEEVQDSLETKFDPPKIIRALSNQLQSSSNVNQSIFSVISDFLVLLIKELEKKPSESLEEWLEPTTTMIYTISEKCQDMKMGILISLTNFLCHTLKLMHKADPLLKIKFMEWITPWAAFFRYSLRILEQNLPVITDHKDNYLKLVGLNLAIFQHIVILSEHNQSWFYAVRRHLILESMLSLLCKIIEMRKSCHLAKSLLTSLILVSTIPGLSDALQTIQAVEQINEALQKSKDNPEELKKDNFKWIQVFQFTIKLATSLLITLSHQYASVAIDLLVKHTTEISNCFTNIRNSPNMSLIEEATHAISLLCNLTCYKHVWMSHDRSSFDSFVVEVSKTCNSLIAFALRPGLIQHLINHPHLPSTQKSSPVSSTHAPTSSPKPRGVPEIENNRPSKLAPLDGEHINLDVHQALFNLLSQMLLFLHNVNPNLLEVLTMINFGTGLKSSQIEYGIGAPNIDPNKTMSLGSFLSCISLCIRMYVKNEKSANASEPSLDQHSTDQIVFTLETSLSMLVSQTLLAHYNPSTVITEREKQFLWTEIRTELNSMLSVITRQSKKIHSLGSSSVVKPSGTILIERPLIKVLLNLVETFFK